MPLSELAALMLVATAMAFTPGPNTTLSAAIAANRGLRPALRLVFAVPVGRGLMLLADLLWLAWKLAGSHALAQRRGGLDIGFGQGVALQFVNVKAWMNALMISAGGVTADAQALQRATVGLSLTMAHGAASAARPLRRRLLPPWTARRARGVR